MWYTDLSSLQNTFAGNLAWISVSVRNQHGWFRGGKLWILSPQILRKLGHEIRKQISHKNYLQKMSIIPSAFFASFFIKL